MILTRIFCITMFTLTISGISYAQPDPFIQQQLRAIQERSKHEKVNPDEE